MSEVGESILRGLEQAVEYAQGERKSFVEHRFVDVDVKAIRDKLGMSQSQFASAFSISLGTLKQWEQGRRVPEGPARVLLQVIEREPEAVRRALAV